LGEIFYGSANQKVILLCAASNLENSNPTETDGASLSGYDQSFLFSQSLFPALSGCVGAVRFHAE
jgi:hypothetical protein